MVNEIVEIGRFFDNLLDGGYKIQTRNGYEFIVPDCVKILTLGNRYVNLLAISRHKTQKHIVMITCHTKSHGDRCVEVTTDHVCMVYNEYNFFENKAAKDISIGDYVQIYSDDIDNEVIGTVSLIEDVGTTDDYVYDCEVDDEIHSFYCNDVLVHNSQFLNIKCVTDDFKSRLCYDNQISRWTDEQKLELWRFMDDFVENDLNKFVQNHVKNWYRTEHSEVLRYSMEYIGDIEIMEAKKHYALHKILSEGPEVVNKIKYSGIELKKASVPKKIKEFLSEIYSSTLTKGWTEKGFSDFINKAYDEFLELDVEDISFWKGYSTPRPVEGFLKMKKLVNEDTGNTVGTTSISAACTFYNQLISKDKDGNGLGIGDRYEEILLGDKVRFTYVKPDNVYGIKYIAFKDGQYPDEFRKIFEVDYNTMFEKCVINPLKGYMTATGFKYKDYLKKSYGDSVDDL